MPWSRGSDFGSTGRRNFLGSFEAGPALRPADSEVAVRGQRWWCQTPTESLARGAGSPAKASCCTHLEGQHIALVLSEGPSHALPDLHQRVARRHVAQRNCQWRGSPWRQSYLKPAGFGHQTYDGRSVGVDEVQRNGGCCGRGCWSLSNYCLLCFGSGRRRSIGFWRCSASGMRLDSRCPRGSRSWSGFWRYRRYRDRRRKKTRPRTRPWRWRQRRTWRWIGRCRWRGGCGHWGRSLTAAVRANRQPDFEHDFGLSR